MHANESLVLCWHDVCNGRGVPRTVAAICFSLSEQMR